VTIKNTIVRGVTPYSPVEVRRHFGGIFYYHIFIELKYIMKFKGKYDIRIIKPADCG
jgi:hypothetical protein